MVLVEFLVRMILGIVVGVGIFHAEIDLSFILIYSGVTLLFMLSNPKTRKRMYR